MKTTELAMSIVCAGLVAGCGAPPRTSSNAPGAGQPAPASAVSVEPAAPTLDDQADEVVQRLAGAMNSSRQSLEDSRYFDVSLVHCPISVADAPPERARQRFLYVQQAISLTADKPYRVRFMSVAPDPDAKAVTTRIYEPVDSAAWVGLCSKPEAERQVPFTAIGKQLCQTWLQREGELYVGGTRAGGCPNTHRGASYTTTQVRLGPTWMESWDRGYNAADEQVWGAVAGPYRFERFEPGSHDAQVVDLASAILGHSDNREQVAAAPRDFTPVTYHMCPIRIPGSQLPAESRASYVHQTISFPGGAYNRERIYHFFRRKDGRLGFESYDLRAGVSLAGLCDKPASERMSFDKAQVDWQSGCAMIFEPADRGAYRGTTEPGGCPSTYKGASRLDIVEDIKRGAFDVWERWYDAKGKQVAGSTKGPYQYRRVKAEK